MKERISAMHETLNFLMGFGAEEDATIAELRERIEALEARVPMEEETEWPHDGDTVWLILSGGSVISSTWKEYPHQKLCRDFLGIYKTKEQAESRAKQVCLVVEELNNGRPVKIRDGRDTLKP